jgi:hypothetical protein
MSRIFLSHSRNDNFEAIALRDWLASEGWKDVFLDLDPERGIAAGQRWERALHDAASRCEAIIFLVSANWLGSGWCTKEYALARGLNKKLFAALIDPTRTIGSLPEELTGVWQLVDLVHGQDLRLFPTQLPGSIEERHIGYSRSGLTRLKRGLEKAGLDARFFPWPPEREPDRAPYRGLKSQEGDDAAIFFGRDAPIVDAIDRLRGLRAGAPPRLMAILGASGAGKSSFLRAGLLPRLNRDYAQFIPLPVVRPGRAALTGETGLVNALAAILPAHSRAELRTAVQGGAGALRPWLAELVQAAAARRDPGDESERPPAFVVAIDQAEELFRAEGREESESLLALLAQLAAGDDPTVIVIFTIRSDSYDALQSAKALEGLRQVAFSLLPMPRGAYNDVIEGPARRVEEAGGKLAIEPALTQRLLIDIEAGAGDALPLLAFTLEQLYLDYRQTGALRLVDYEKFGGIKGAIDAAAERALVRADADPRIPRDREARLALLRRGLIPWLAGVDPDTKTPRRNIARRADIPLEAAPLIDLLVEERLLSVDTRVSRNSKTGDETRESTIEPTHEALLRQWGLLDGWLTEDFGLLATLEGVKRTARDWDANARGDSWLAHQGQRLAEALALDGRPDIAARLDATDRAYLAGCRAREEAARDEAEQRRREREQEQGRKLADARKIAFRTGVGAVVAVLFAIMAGALGYYGLTEKTLADQKAADAVRQKNAADAATNEATAQKLLADQKTREANAHKADAEAAAKKAQEQTAIAEAAAKSTKSLLNIYQELASFLPEEMQLVLNQAKIAYDDPKHASDVDDLTQTAMLTQLAAYIRDTWDYDKAKQLLNDASKKLTAIRATSPQLTLLRAEIEEITADLDAEIIDATDEYRQALASFKGDRDTQLDQARLHRKIGAVEIAHGDFLNAGQDINEARTLLESVPGAIDERANLDDLTAWELAQKGKGDLALQALQEAVRFDRQALADAKSKGEPFLRLTVALAAHLEHLGDELRRSGQETAGPTYDEAEQLASEVLKTYPNQMSTRFMIDLIRHGNMQLDATGSAKTSRESRRTAKETALEAAFGNGFGRFKFGMTPAQVNELAGNPYDISQLPRAYEYTTDDVRYFWLLVSEVPDFQTFYQGAPCLRNRAAGYRDSAGRHDSDYAAFLFHENALIRISIRFEGQTQPGCPDRSNVLPELAQRYGMPVWGTQGQWRLGWQTPHASLFGSTSSAGPMLDIVSR